MKISRPWLIALLVLALLAAGTLRLVAKRRAAAQAVPAAAQAAPVVELQDSDLSEARVRRLTLVLPITGSVKAANAAVVKARVAGELRGLDVREGDAVAAGAVLAHIDPTEYRARDEQARLQAQAARAQVAIAQRQYDNNRALVDQGFISKTALETSAANLEAAEANLRAALAAAEVTAKALADTRVIAPIAGVVSQRLAQSGERVGVDARIVELVDPRRMELEAPLTAEDAARMRPGLTARVTVEGMGEPLEATLLRLNPAAQAGTRGVLAYLGLPAVPGLRQGLFAQGTLALGTREGLSVPLDAVRTDKPEPYVQTVERGHVAHRPVRVIERGQAEGRTWVLIEGIDAGTRVLAGSVGALRSGTAVQTAAAATVADTTAPATPAPTRPSSTAASTATAR